MRFAVITYIEHSNNKSYFYSYAPYIREMNIWAKFANELEIVAPLKADKITEDQECYLHSNVVFTQIPGINFQSFNNFWNSIIKIPIICFKIFGAMKRADHIHLRCPGNISLIGCIIQIFFPSTPKTAKYAGNWDPKSKQPWSYRLQKAILRNTFLSRNLKILVYGQWDSQTANVLPFFTASFSEKEIEKNSRDYSETLNFIFVGTLSEGKQPLFAIKLIEKLLASGRKVTLKLYGSGNLEEKVNSYISSSRFADSIRLIGFIDKSELKAEYIKSHFLILPSVSEGWPKVVAEAMFFGSIPIATRVSCVAWMLGEGERGILIPDNLELATEIVEERISDNVNLGKLSLQAQKWSQNYTLEKFEKEIKKIL